MLPFVFALSTGLFWGLYGPILTKARLADAQPSPFKPFVAIGVAYLIIAVLGGLLGMYFKGDSFQISSAGATWGFGAGALGAIGALTLTLCMFSGGARMPHVVMPLVFGGAVTISALWGFVTSSDKAHISPMLWVGIAGMLVCVVIITMNAPHAAPPKSPDQVTQQSHGASQPKVG
jgi:lysylphosphatidylglycerol synthetase-like protein (DUF2156 family)